VFYLTAYSQNLCYPNHSLKNIIAKLVIECFDIIFRKILISRKNKQ
jgi:hypothetical protein